MPAEIVEQAPALSLFSAPQHPYTVGLLGSIPLLGARRDRLTTIPGSVPSLTAEFRGCRFADRCPFVEPSCRAQAPALVPIARRHRTRCLRAPLEALVA